MKKIYQAPELTIVKLRMRSHLMDISVGGTASISSRKADGNAFVKENNQRYNIWDDDWNK